MERRLSVPGDGYRYPEKTRSEDFGAKMSNSRNPYAPPRPRSRRSPDANFEHQRNPGVILASVLVGGLVTSVAVYLIYVDDPRTGTSGPSLEIAVYGGAALSSSIWAASGWLQRLGTIGLVVSIIVASASAGLWIAIGGTYADVLAAAACVAWPFGGLAASIGLYFWARSRRAPLTGTQVAG